MSWSRVLRYRLPPAFRSLDCEANPAGAPQPSFQPHLIWESERIPSGTVGELQVAEIRSES